MNWIIRTTKTVRFHTNLHEILKPIWNDLKEYNWMLTDLDFISDQKTPINFEHDFFILNREQFKEVYESDTQIIWGIISAVPKGINLDKNFISNLSAEHEKVWKPDKFLIDESFLEIVAFDSGYTIIKFKDEKFSKSFREYFKEEAIDLQKFNDKWVH